MLGAVRATPTTLTAERDRVAKILTNTVHD